MGEVQTWSLNKREGVPLRILAYLGILTSEMQGCWPLTGWVSACMGMAKQIW